MRKSLVWLFAFAVVLSLLSLKPAQAQTTLTEALVCVGPITGLSGTAALTLTVADSGGLTLISPPRLDCPSRTELCAVGSPCPPPRRAVDQDIPLTSTQSLAAWSVNLSVTGGSGLAVTLQSCSFSGTTLPVHLSCNLRDLAPAGNTLPPNAVEFHLR